MFVHNHSIHKINSNDKVMLTTMITLMFTAMSNIIGKPMGAISMLHNEEKYI